MGRFINRNKMCPSLDSYNKASNEGSAFVDADGDHGIPAAWLMHNALTAYAADWIEDSVVEISWDQPHSPAEIDVQDLYNYIDGIVAREAQ